MVLTEHETLNLALKALRGKLTLPEAAVIQIENNPYQNFDAVIKIMNVDFLCKVKNTVTTATVGNVASRLMASATAEQHPILLIAKYITPTVMDDLASNGINTLDCAGNCYIRYEKDNTVRFHLANKVE